jgi:hypothetical protein
MNVRLFPWRFRRSLPVFVSLFTAVYYSAAPVKGADIPKVLLPVINVAQTAASKVAPVEVKPGTKFERDFKAAHHRWVERVLVAPFRARTKDAGNAAATAFVEEAGRQFVEDCCCNWPDKLAAEGNRLLKEGADDPLVLYFAARNIQLIEDRADDAKKRYEHALERAEKLSLSPALRRLIALDLASLPHTEVKVAEWDARAGEWAVAALNDGSYGKDDAAVFVRHVVVDCAGDKHLDRAPEVMHAAATSLRLPEWARRTIQGKTEISKAWLARGKGFADTVSRKGWASFEEHLKRARAELVKAWELNPREPFAAAAMITVVMGGEEGKGETVRLWFDRAVAAQFDYKPAYSSLLNAWRPRWGGDHDAMYEFGRACRATGRYDTEVPRVFTEACNLIAKDFDDWEELYRSGSFPGMKEEMVDHHRKLLAEPTRAGLRWMDRSFFAVNAWLVGAYDLADESLRALPEGLFPLAVDKLRRLNRSESGFRREVALMNSPAQKSYVAGEKQFAEEEFTEAKPHFEAALSQTPAEAKALIEARIEMIAQRAAFEKGEWVNPLVRPGLPGWRVVYGEWEGGPEGQLVVHGNGSKGLIVYELSPAPDYEWRAEFRIEVRQASIGRRPGVWLSWLRQRQESLRWTLGGAEGRSFSRLALSRIRVEKAPVSTVSFQETTSFPLECKMAGHLEVNGVEVFRDLEPRVGEASAPSWSGGAHLLRVWARLKRRSVSCECARCLRVISPRVPGAGRRCPLHQKRGG